MSANIRRDANIAGDSAKIVKTDQSKRPRIVTFFALGVLILSVVHLVRAVRAIQLWAFLSDLLPLSPLYLVLTGLVWFGVGLGLAWMIWRGVPRTGFLVRIAAVAYVLYFWADRLWVSNAGLPVNWPFNVAASILGLAFVYVFFKLRPVEAYFGGSA